MKDSLATGLSGTQRYEIDRDRTIDFMGEEARVYATPALVRDIENTCRDLLLEHEDAGEDSVGMEVAVKHLAPTLMGMKVDVEIEIARVDGNAVSFDVIVGDPVDDVVASGRHDRFIVEVDKVKQRLAAKAAKAAELT